MARPEALPKTPIASSVDSGSLARIDHAAHEWGVTRAQAIARLLEIGFANRRPMIAGESALLHTLNSEGVLGLEFRYGAPHLSDPALSKMQALADRAALKTTPKTRIH